MLANQFESTFLQDDLDDVLNLLQQNRLQEDYSTPEDEVVPGAPVAQQQQSSPVPPQPTQPSRHVMISSLPHYYTKEMLYLLASRFGQLVKVKLNINAQTKEPYGLVEFASEQDAMVAVKMLQNYVPQGTNKAIQASFAPNQDSDNLKTNVYVSGLPFDMKGSDFNYLFSQFGPIVESKISIGKFQDELGRPKQLGFVRYADPAHAEIAIQTMNGSVIKDSQNPTLSFRIAARLAKETKNPLQKEKIKKKIAEVKALTHNLPNNIPTVPVQPNVAMPKFTAIKPNYVSPAPLPPTHTVQGPLASYDALRVALPQMSPSYSLSSSTSSSNNPSPQSSSPTMTSMNASPSKPQMFDGTKLFSLATYINPLSFAVHQAI